MKRLGLDCNVLLAPMAGITDLPLRRIVRELGDFLVFSEMIASNAVVRHVARTCKMLDANDDSLTSVQIAGADPHIMAEAAKLSEDLGAKFIDINMGCPVKKIVKTYAGSALMKDLHLAAKIIENVVNSVKIPVTLKTRLGWSEQNKNASELAKIAEDLGIRMITIHGRTRSQLFTGHADWKAIKIVKKSIKIPLIANGDIKNMQDMQTCLLDSGADGVMIGRAAIHNPWILPQIAYGKMFSNIEKFAVIKRHLQYIEEFYDEQKSIVMCKKSLMHYCVNIQNAASIRKNITMIDSKIKVYELLKMLEEQYLNNE